HRGKWFNVRGPLNVSRSPQGRPVFIQAGASDRGRDFAARWAEIIFVTHASVDSAKEFYCDMKARAAKAGRDPDQMKILPGMVPIVAETKAMAEESASLSTNLRTRWRAFRRCRITSISTSRNFRRTACCRHSTCQACRGTTKKSPK